MRKVFLVSIFALALTSSISVLGQNQVPEGAVVVDVTLPDSKAEEAKSLKELQSAVLFKGTDRITFHVYLNEGSSMKDLENELAAMFGDGVKVSAKKD